MGNTVSKKESGIAVSDKFFNGFFDRPAVSHMGCYWIIYKLDQQPDYYILRADRGTEE